ncbi:MAG: V-type ATP synthase subunit E [Spirochaetes bacterium]|nr:V-type ATP synthase subunit E [Spirochaetota bacterium]
MESKLQELTKKIYKEGVEKANNEAKTILENANNESEKIINNAKKEADSIISNAKKESEQLNNKIISEMRLASNQAVSLLKQEVTGLLSYSALSTKIEKSMQDVDFIKEIIKEIVSKWNAASKSLDLDLVLPKKSKEKLTEYFKQEAKDILNKGIDLKFEERMDGGFKIGPKDNSFILSFTEKDFKQFFQSFLKPKTKVILFPEKIAE